MQIEQIEQIKKISGGNFLKFIEGLSALEVTHFITDAKTAKSSYFSKTGVVEELKTIFNFSIGPVDIDAFVASLKSHQRGEIDFPTWLEKTAASGVASWEVSLIEKTCAYFDQEGNLLYMEVIPTP